MKSVGIVMLMMGGSLFFLSQSHFSQNLASVLTSVLELRGLLVLIKVSIRVDYGVLLLELIGTFLANAVGMMRKSSDAYICRCSCSTLHEFEKT